MAVTFPHVRRSARPAPAFLWVPGLAAVFLTLIPLWYLWERSTQRGWPAWERELTGPVAGLLLNSIWLAVLVSAGCVAVALPAAWLTTRTDLPFRRAWTVLFALPLAIPSYIMGMTVVAALGPRGIVQGWLEPFGVQRLPEIYGLPGATLTLIAVGFPYVFLVLRAALRSVDPAEEEASRSLGVGPWGTFARVTLPALVPAIAAAVLLVALYVLSDFGAVAQLRYDTFTRAIYIRQEASFDRTGAAILGVILAGVTVFVLLGETLLRGRYQRRLQAKKIAPPRAVPLGRWRWPALAFLCTIVLFSLVMPVGVLTYWLVNGLQSDARFPAVADAVQNSLTIAAAGAAVTVLLGLPVAILATRFSGLGSRAIEQAAYVTHSLPGIVVAIALVAFGITYARPFYQTTWMLLFAYVILFLPNALAALRGPLVRQSIRLEEAAEALGRRPSRVVWSVTLPLARPGVIAGLALVFLTILKELPATLLLSPPGYRTLPGIIWSHSNEAYYAAAAFPALILLAAAAVPVAILVWRGDVDSLRS